MSDSFLYYSTWASSTTKGVGQLEALEGKKSIKLFFFTKEKVELSYLLQSLNPESIKGNKNKNRKHRNFQW